MKLTVGQTVYRAPDTLRQNYVLKQFVVEKVGRQYAYLVNGEDKIALNRMIGKRGTYFVSLEAYEEFVNLTKEWKAFGNDMNLLWRIPEHLTFDDIRSMRLLLRGSK